MYNRGSHSPECHSIENCNDCPVHTVIVFGLKGGAINAHCILVCTSALWSAESEASNNDKILILPLVLFNSDYELLRSKTRLACLARLACLD